MIELSKRMSRVHPSPIREMLKVTERPDVLSFAGGLPAPEMFPVEAMARAHAEVLAHDGAGALQYGATEGILPLREWVSQRMTHRGLPCRPEEVLITAGSQQGLDLVGKTLIDPGDVVVVEAPSYLAALQAFSVYDARFAVVGTDDEGMRVDELEQLLEHTRARFVYLVPNFQNPRGTTLTLERRLALVRLAREHGVAIVEDDPYGELRYTGVALPPIAGLDRDAPVIHLGSFSKTLAPGLRLGYAISDEQTVRAMVIAKQAADLHTGGLSQRAVARLLETFDYDAHLRDLQRVYGERCAAMLASIERSFPKGTQHTRPEGGLFVWAELPAGIDARDLLEETMREKVAFVQGAPFYPSQPKHNSLRLNFSNRPPEMIARGMGIIGACAERMFRTVAKANNGRAA
jgi:2-aminoadipate transaminase